MENREVGITEIYDRIKRDRTTLGLNGFKKIPTIAVDQRYMPCVILSVGEDNIIKASSRGKLQYPARRSAEIILEIIAPTSTDMTTLFKGIRKTVFTDDSGEKNPTVADDTFIRENRTSGPTGFGLPDVIAMTLILDLVYTDNGF